LIAAAERHPHIAATVFELPTTADIARRRLSAAGLTSRVTVVAGDATTDALPSGYDVFLVANLIHYLSPDENRTLLRRVRDAAQPGFRLLVADFWTDAAHTEPLHAALMAGEFAVHLRNGDVYSVDEGREWLQATGWKFVEHIPLAGPQSVVVAEAV
jgi:O-methyltransferase involved in polyketide biosynthesis